MNKIIYIIRDQPNYNGLQVRIWDVLALITLSFLILYAPMNGTLKIGAGYRELAFSRPPHFAALDLKSNLVLAPGYFMSNLLQSKKAFKYSVVSVKISRYIVHYTPRYFYTYTLSLNAFLLLKAITHAISRLGSPVDEPLNEPIAYNSQTICFNCMDNDLVKQFSRPGWQLEQEKRYPTPLVSVGQLNNYLSQIISEAHARLPDTQSLYQGDRLRLPTQAKVSSKALHDTQSRFQFGASLGQDITSYLNYTETTKAMTPNHHTRYDFIYERKQLHGREQLQPTHNKKLELGLSTALSDRRLVFSNTFFYHAIYNEIVKENGELGKSLAQRGQLERYGLSFQTAMKVTENWQVLSTLKYEASSIVQDNDRNLVGNRPQKSPRLNFEMKNQYKVPFASDLALYFKTNVESESFKDDGESQPIGPRTYLGMGFNYQQYLKEGQLTLGLDLNELLDLDHSSANASLRAAPFIDRPVNKLKFLATYIF